MQIFTFIFTHIKLPHFKFCETIVIDRAEFCLLEIFNEKNIFQGRKLYKGKVSGHLHLTKLKQMANAVPAAPYQRLIWIYRVQANLEPFQLLRLDV